MKHCKLMLDIGYDEAKTDPENLVRFLFLLYDMARPLISFYGLLSMVVVAYKKVDE